jgi:RNA polymerase sigma factor (sigma-70 family)
MPVVIGDLMLLLTLALDGRCRYVWVMDAPPILAVRVPASGLPIRLGRLGDESLARFVGNGSERAFAAIYKRYHQHLYRYCRSILHNDADAQDALQSTLAGALAALQRGKRDAPLRPWLFRIAHNEAISLVRRRGDFGELTEAPERGVPSAEDAAGGRARLALLIADLRELPDRQRGALLMRELSGLSHEEIATALGTSVGTAKQAIFEARRALAEFGEGRLMTCEDVRRTVSDGDGRALRGRRVRAHLRDCTTCAAFAAAIPARRADLQALAPPLPPILAAGLLARLLGAGSGHGAGGAGAVVVGVAGKTAGATLAAKALVGVAVFATAAAGVTGALTLARHDARRPAGARTVRTMPAGTASRHAKQAIGAHAPRGSRNDAHSGVLGGRPRSAIPNAQGRSAGGAPGIRGGSGAVHGGSKARGLRPGQGVDAPTRRRTGSEHARRRPGAGHHSGGPRASVPAAGRPITAGGRSPTSSGNGQPSHAQTGVRGATSASPSPRAPSAPMPRSGQSPAPAR